MCVQLTSAWWDGTLLFRLPSLPLLLFRAGCCVRRDALAPFACVSFSAPLLFAPPHQRSLDVLCRARTLTAFQVEGQEVMTSWQASIYRMMARDGMMQ